MRVNDSEVEGSRLLFDLEYYAIEYAYMMVNLGVITQ